MQPSRQIPCRLSEVIIKAMVFRASRVLYSICGQIHIQLDSLFGFYKGVLVTTQARRLDDFLHMIHSNSWNLHNALHIPGRSVKTTPLNLTESQLLRRVPLVAFKWLRFKILFLILHLKQPETLTLRQRLAQQLQLPCHLRKRLGEQSWMEPGAMTCQL